MPFRHAASALFLAAASLFATTASAVTYSITNLQPPGQPESQAIAINNAGEVVTIATSTYGFKTSWLYSGGIQTMLPQPLGWAAPMATALDEAGRVTGWLQQTSTREYHAFVYDHGTMSILQSIAYNDRLGDSYFQPSFHLPSYNAADQHVETRIVNSYYNAVRVEKDGTVLNIAQIDGLGGSSAFGINAAGDVVGSGGFGNPYVEAFLYTSADGHVVNLNHLTPETQHDFGWELIHAKAINDVGQIVGLGRAPGSGSFQAFLLTPVPEPASYVLALTSLVILVGGQRWKKHG